MYLCVRFVGAAVWVVVEFVVVVFVLLVGVVKSVPAVLGEGDRDFGDGGVGVLAEVSVWVGSWGMRCCSQSRRRLGNGRWQGVAGRRRCQSGRQ